MGFIDFIGTVGMLAAFVLGVSPISSLYKGYKEMEINNITYSYMISAVTNCTLWSIFGLKKPDIFLFITNTILLFLFFSYFLLFLYIKKIENNKIGFAFLFIILAYYLIYIIFPGEFVGFLAFVINSVWSLTAIENVKDCLKTKNPKFINVQIGIITLFCGFCWSLYGILSQIIFIFIPNVIGVLVWNANLLCYFWCINKINNDNIIIIYMKKILLSNQTENIDEKNVYDDIYENDNKKALYDFKTAGPSTTTNF